MTDFTFANRGSITILTPVSNQAIAWVDMHLLDDSEEVQMWAGGVCIEPRYAAPILEAINACGMTVQS